MRVEVDPELFGAAHDILSVDTTRERFVFHLLSDGPRVHLVNAARRPHECGGRDESRELVDGEQRFRHTRRARDPRVRRVAEDRLEDVVGPAALAEYAHALTRMAHGRRVLLIWPALVVEVVHQAGKPP